MGSWSVYCGISQIAIRGGRKCVFLPLKKSTSSGCSYLPYLPATLPIFGEYDDYGGMENIVEDENTKLIEEHFKCTIDEFCFFFTRGSIRDDEDDFPKKLKNNKEINGWSFMFIDMDVYKFMSKSCDGYGGKGNLDFGNPEILKLLGFEFVTKSSDPLLNKSREPKRYDQIWRYEDKEIFSDGTFLNKSDGHGIYSLTGDYSSLKEYIGEIPEDKKWIGEKAMWQLHEYLGKDAIAEKLFWIIGGKNKLYSSGMFDRLKPNELNELISLLGKEDEESKNRALKIKKIGEKRNSVKLIHDKYTNYTTYFNELMSQLVTIRHNLHSMSGYFAPYILYLTPQCGEFESHQIILEKFAEINKKIMNR